MDIFTEPDGHPDTLSRLGPLRGLAGSWQGSGGVDDHPTVDGAERDVFVERFEAQPIDFQTNGPQLFYGLRYHTRIVKPGEVAMFHEQVGFWLWEPNELMVVMTLAIPRGQSLLAIGHCQADATTFEIRAERGSSVAGILSNPFLEEHFTTESFRMVVTTHMAAGTWSYEEHTVLRVSDRAAPFDHVDTHTLSLLDAPTPNPLALMAAQESHRRD